ncbi:Heat shock protein J [Actinomyces bovis]|uniref:Heat shock protein J n=1 Tax=Actinomyces bovis TaxID=1658 RepID=A0ABY1VRK4_9ACTO|nr:DnaJ C-terminal domain-containing protein [Actinomyces bovis]SPT53668.1 Heat shock protein J [Actinomyces bovis]VEG55766.1 Heat shock protein J [Actinomyces israelii]
MASQDWMTKDFYAVLGISKGADAAAIKKAYRTLAKKYHPDRNPGDEAAAERFKNIGEAYAVLSDEGERKQYDAIRSMAGGGARFTSGASGAGSAGFEDIFSSMFGGASTGRPGAEPDIDELLRMFGGQASPTRKHGRPGAFDFGGFGGFGSRGRSQRGADVTTTVTLPLRDAVSGTDAELTADGRTTRVRIPAGVTDGKKIRLRGKGRPGSGGGEAGDMIVTIKVAEHPVYGFDGTNLTMKLPVTLSEAALGGDVEVPLPDGATARMRIKAGTASGTTMRLRGKGPKSKGGKPCDVLVILEVAVPKRLSKEAKQALEAFDAAMGECDLRAAVREAATK